MMLGKRLILLLFLSILLGTIAARAVAAVANGYFHDTMDSLVGQYGEYDFIVQVREEQKENAKPVLDGVIAEHFAGGRYQEAPVIGGRANFFVAIPDSHKTKEVYERIDSYFSVLPGAAGLSIISEPRLSIRGVPQGALELLRKEIEQMAGVRFVFLDGPTIHVMIGDMAQSSTVQEAIAQLLASQRVIEIRFPTGAEPKSPVRLGEEIARRLREEHTIDYARYVSIDETRGEEARLSAALTEMKNFLSEYRSTVTIALDEGKSLSIGDRVVLRRNGEPSRGQETVTAAVTRLEKGKAVGIITAGDGASLPDDITAYRINEEMQYTAVGRAHTESPARRLAQTIGQIDRLSSALPAGRGDLPALIDEARTMLGGYETLLVSVRQTAGEIEKLSRSVSQVSDDVAQVDSEKLRGDLAQAIRSVGSVGKWLNLVSWASKDVREAKASLAEVEKHMVSLDKYLADFDVHTQKAKQAETFFAQMTDSAKQTNSVLAAFDIRRAEEALGQAETSLHALAEADIAALGAQMKSVALTLPSLRDDDINETIAMLDKLIEGHLIPNKRIQILTADVPADEAVSSTVRAAVGHANVSISQSELGIIEPNTYLEVYRMLYEVKRVLAGMTAVVLTVLLLVLDHTAILSMMKLRRRQKYGRHTGGSILLRLKTAAWPASGYGAMVGAILLSAVFYLAGGGIPYVPFGAVPICGALLGLIAAVYAERISPVSEEEIMAGESLGMTDNEILREIVIPSSRPGLLMLVNRFTLRFR